MVWWILIVAVVLGLALVARAIWRASHPDPGVLGATDLSYEVSRSLSWSADGGRFVLSGAHGDTLVILTRRGPGAGTDELEVEIRPREGDLSYIQTRLEQLGLAVSDPARESGMVVFASGQIPDQSSTGHLVNALLRAAGLADGEAFTYRYEGQLDAQEMRRRPVWQ
ncbi:MAG: hypothetical protein QGG89_13885 [Vicinamibacterales bacterium]|jgi:hypothetical protein|nr:hypothetical protein [Vicinamibacterales bacterium]